MTVADLIAELQRLPQHLPFREAGDPPPTGGERAAPCLEKHCD